MSEYKHTISKAGLTGFAQDPNQQVSNAGGIDLNAPLTVANGVGFAIGGIYAKKVITTAGKAIVGQFGSSRLERGIEVGTTIGKYILIGVASGPSAGITVPLTIATDLAVMGIDNAVESHAINLDNERTIEERGTLMQLGAGGYYG